MNHPSYRDFQAQVAALSLFSTASVYFLPPNWDGPTPYEGDADEKVKSEWKRRIKMYCECTADDDVLFSKTSLIFIRSGTRSRGIRHREDHVRVRQLSVARALVRDREGVTR